MSATAHNQVFSAVHTIGGLIPADMLVRIAEGKDVSGSKPADYRVIVSRSVRDDAERHWDYLKSVWKELRDRLPVAPEAETPADPTGVAATQWLEPLFAELGFGRLTALGASGIISDDGAKTFAISHRWSHVPIHLAPWNAALDKRPAGAGGVPPQSMVQELLNRSDAHLWGVLTNGRQLRLLRDSSALATAAYVEFDLEAIFDGELFSEFVLLYRLLHVSRFEAAEGVAPSTCWLEKWRTEAITAGTRALDQLRKGVQDAITALGTGFLRHPDNAALRENVDPQALHNALLRLVYRLLFLFVAEDRDALHHPDADQQTRERYAAYFSSARLRAQARRRRGTTHSDLYQALRIVLDALGDENGRPELGLRGLGGLFDYDSVADNPLKDQSLSNDYLLTAVRRLSLVRDAGSRRWRSVDYRNLDAEELGSIYESLLELVPKHSAVDRTFELVELAGNTRKTTGSYYTPSSLIDCLLDSTLDPVIDDAVKRGEHAATAVGQPDPSDAIVSELLSLTVCDPACGSGHFLVAAARRIAKRVAAVRERNPEPTIDAVRHSLREVVARCIYGVDLNPMAVELAKVSLWMEALEPGKPLSFLDAHVKHGNALIGATPVLLKQGVPDEAFKPIEGDDRKHAKALEKQNLQERAGQASLFDVDEGVKVANRVFADGLRRILNAPSDDLRAVRSQEAAYRDWEESADYVRARHVADAWCAAFMWRKTKDAPPAVTQAVLRALEDPDASAASRETHDEIVRLRDQYRFFHWHLEFPDVFDVHGSGTNVDPATGWSGGFACVLGNPPWERIKLQEQEFFAQRDEAIATAKNAAARKRLIAELKDDEDRRSLYEEFAAAKRRSEGESHFLRNGGRYPLTGRGDINTYAVFSETDRALIGPCGRMGVIVPTGIGTDATTQMFFRDCVTRKSLVSLYDFENEDKVFSEVHNQFRFCLLTLSGPAYQAALISLVFKVRQVDQIPSKRFALSSEEITLLNPNTGTCPVFRSRRDAEITLGIYRRVPVLVKEGDPRGNLWGISFMKMFDMANDSHLFRSREELESAGWVLTGNIFTRDAATMLPLCEAKLLHHYDHRFSTYDGATQEQLNKGTLPRLTPDQHDDPDVVTMPRYWVSGREVEEKLSAKGWRAGWLLGWREICRAADERTVIASVFPSSAVGNKFPLSFPAVKNEAVACLYACQTSFVFDYVSRQKIGGASMSMFIWQQLPTLSPDVLTSHSSWLVVRVLELTYAARDMAPFAHDLGDDGAPFRWDEDRRAIIRAELDALFFHLYGIDRDDVDYIMETFSIVKRKDEARYGRYRTKELIIAEYDRMAAAGVSLINPLADGENYTSTVNPPPGHGPRHAAITNATTAG
ncbi:Eco57I restriction-modification methylase domain-containing protein [Micromonospora chersina]|uniref:site-specific DNA-methyltransferase (adenine-specific) n=1 Tax=Micromonospora chersina TaxID=47854 RepID=A0A1C6U9U9_9ACTN|nr:DNA methyltransferase [Micromonospora chersina]SCL50744.1 Methyltransferase domain-containing protein [Micromonospora chersina]